ncbi:MAG: MoaD/ThiS family protein [Desulfobacterales bacterium]|nr:MoaD/ThiS family protein [Deltaproteobacteria bacterium]MBT8362525.1 MoaD/ThiS family protein [Deltaproteobacteria bacterium]NNK94457.1 MoaD/ThiS family protein [Desulfobacterales bacterium]
MEIELKCFATLRQYCPGDGRLEIAENTSVQEALETLSVPLEEVKLIFVNGVRKEPTAILEPGDRLGIFPPVGGG